MKKYFNKKFTGTAHVLGGGEAPESNGDGSKGKSLIDKLEEDKKAKKAPPKVSLTEHLTKLEAERRNAPLQFCQDVPERVEEEEDRCEEDMTVQISLLMSNAESSTVAVDLLRRILRNLILNPSEAKFRKLNLINRKVQEGLVQVPGALDFMCLSGFVKKEEQLLYEGVDSMELPKKGLQLLNRHFPEQIEKQENNAEAAAPEKLVECPQRERHTQLLLLKPTEVELPDWFFERTSAEFKAEYFTMTKKKEQDQTFMTSAQREKLKGHVVQHTFAVIRVRLPEGVLLQGEFNAGEQIDRIHEWVADHLRDATRPFELFLPSRTKLGSNETVRNCQLMPATLLSFHWTDGMGITTPEPTVTDDLIMSAVIDSDQTSAVVN